MRQKLVGTNERLERQMSEREAAETQQPDIVVTDMIMPERKKRSRNHST